MLISLVLSMVLGTPALATTEILQNCAAPLASEATLGQQDFPFSTPYDMKSLKQKFTEMYEGPKRLLGRAYYDQAAQEYKIQVPVLGSPVLVTLPELFIATIKKQIESSLARRYADFIFFPDMGHSHFLVPQKKWSETYNRIPIEKMDQLFAGLMSDPDVLITYHTAEQIKMRNEDGTLLPDLYLNWRYFSRNVVGLNRGSESVPQVVLHPDLKKYNTISELEGHHWFGMGFYIHSQKDGCFSYKTPAGEILYFDLSFTEFPYQQ